MRQALFSVLGSKPDGKKKEEAVGDMVSTISFIQANLQQNMAVSRILSRTEVVKGTDTTLIQEKWCREGCIMGLNIPGYTLFHGGRTDRPTACILVRKMNTQMLPEFAYRDPTPVLIKYNRGEVEKEQCCVLCPFAF